MPRSVIRLAAAGLALAASSLAHAQGSDAATPPDLGVYAGDYLTIGVGAVYGPDYEGSNDYDASAVPLIQARFHGVEVSPRAGGVAFDFIPDHRDAKVNFDLGPVVRLRSNRHGHIEDPVVRRLGKLDRAVELGVNAGISFDGVLDPYDSISLGGDVRWDVAGAHHGMIVSPSLGYFTPVSRGAAIKLTLSADHVDHDYADYYFTVTPAGSAASGLPAFKAGGGWKSAGATVLVAVDLDGNLANGGWGAFGIGGYERLLGDAKRSPITSVRGSANQWLVGAGLGYTF